jgi:acetyl esterase/lipase
MVRGFFILLGFCVAAAASEPLVVDVWPEGRVPDEVGKIARVGPERVRMSPGLSKKQVEVTTSTRMITGVTRPTISIFSPATEKNTGTAVMIFPGGGYWDLYWELEGEEVAAWLNSVGITGVLLKYRVPRREGEIESEPARRPLQDAQRAMRLVRSRAVEWGIDPKRIGTVGFSAGGHLSIAMATQFEEKTYQPMDELEKISCRPDFAISVYPGYLKSKEKDELAAGIRAPTNAPPVFLVHGDADIISPSEGSVLMYQALKKVGVPAEVHIYAATAHDFGVRKEEDRAYSTWTDSCVDWMRAIGVLSNRTNSGN